MHTVARLALPLSILLLAPLVATAAGGRYLMDMIVFEQPDAQPEQRAGERPGADHPVGSLDRGAPGIQLLDRRESPLGPAAYTLRRKGARILAHRRWIHDFDTPGSTGWLSIRGKALEGAIRLKRGRYIHLFTDLRSGADGFPVREHGRLRSGELHYIDHPQIGILVQADRLEQPEPQAPASPASRETPAPAPRQDDNPPEKREPARETPRALPDNS